MKERGLKRFVLLFGLLIFLFAYGGQIRDSKSVPFRDVDDFTYKEDKLLFEPHFDWVYRLLRFSRYPMFIRIGVASFMLSQLLKIIRLLLRKKN